MGADYLSEELELRFEKLQHRPDLRLHALLYQWGARQFSSGLVMDLGSEVGIGIQLMRDANPELEYIGCDINRTSLTATNGLRIPKLKRQLQADGTSLPLGSNTLTGICMVNLLHLTDDPGAILSEASRVLKPGGKTLLSIPLRQLPARWDSQSLVTTFDRLIGQRFSDFHTPERFAGDWLSFSKEDILGAGIYLRICFK